MSRPLKSGFDYFPLDTDFFSDDRRIRALFSNFGGDGIVLYLYILAEIYRNNGYYLQYDDTFLDCCSADIHIAQNKIGLMLQHMVNRSLFDDKLFATMKVLTSHGIQMRFQEMCKRRSKTRRIFVEKTLWILKEEETQGFISCAKSQNFHQKNDGYFRKNDSYCQKNAQSKVKESKVKESSSSSSSNISVISAEKKPTTTTTTTITFGKYNNVILTDNEYEKLKSMLPDSYEYYINRLSEYMFSSGKQYNNHLSKMLYFAEKDKENGYIVPYNTNKQQNIDCQIETYAKKIMQHARNSKGERHG